MNILLESQSFVIKEALENLFKELIYNPQILSISNIKKIDIEEIIDLDFLFVQLKENWEEQINIIKEYKNNFKTLKVMILDLKNDRRIFEAAVQVGVDGYIIGFTEKDEFIFILKKVLSGKKVYESDLVQRVLYNNQNKSIDGLTKREIEVLRELGKGLNNKQISINLYITEYTVKKHVSNILSKLNLKNRQEVILYVTQNPI